jgi:hypothetical protein
MGSLPTTSRLSGNHRRNSTRSRCRQPGLPRDLSLCCRSASGCLSKVAATPELSSPLRPRRPTARYESDHLFCMPFPERGRRPRREERVRCGNHCQVEQAFEVSAQALGTAGDESVSHGEKLAFEGVSHYAEAFKAHSLPVTPTPAGRLSHDACPVCSSPLQPPCAPFSLVVCQLQCCLLLSHTRNSSSPPPFHHLTACQYVGDSFLRCFGSSHELRIRAQSTQKSSRMQRQGSPGVRVSLPFEGQSSSHQHFQVRLSLPSLSLSLSLCPPPCNATSACIIHLLLMPPLMIITQAPPREAYDLMMTHSTVCNNATATPPVTSLPFEGRTTNSVLSLSPSLLLSLSLSLPLSICVCVLVCVCARGIICRISDDMT